MQNNKEENNNIDSAAISAEWLAVRLLDVVKSIQEFRQEKNGEKILPSETIEELNAALSATLTTLQKNYFSEEPQRFSQLALAVTEGLWKLRHVC